MALSNDPENEVAKINIAKLLIKKGESNKAKGILESLLLDCKDKDIKDDARQLIDSIGNGISYVIPNIELAAKT